MAHLDTIGSRRVIMCETDIGIPQPLCDQTGTPVGYDIADMFDLSAAKRQSAFEKKAYSIADTITKFEDRLREGSPFPKLKNYR
jgi:hypothetical protein